MAGEKFGVNGTPAIITAMRAGDVDVGIINSSDVIKLDAQKTLDLRVIGSPNGRNFWMIVSRDSINSLAELRGKPYAISRVGSEDQRSPGVADQRYAPAGGGRLGGEQGADVEQLIQRRHPHHAGVGEQRIDAGVVGRQRGRVRPGAPPAGLGASSLQRHDRQPA